MPKADDRDIWEKYFDVPTKEQLEQGRKDVEGLTDFLRPGALAIGGLATGALIGGRLGKFIRKPRLGATLGGAVGGPIGVYGGVKAYELQERAKKKRRK